jgi:hypothetical protein
MGRNDPEDRRDGPGWRDFLIKEELRVCDLQLVTHLEVHCGERKPGPGACRVVDRKGASSDRC